MKNVAIALCAAALVASAAAPAIAQPGGWTIDNRINEVQRAVQRAVADGSLERVQYDKLEYEVHRIAHNRDEYRRMHGGQLSPDAEQHLDGDLDTVLNQLHFRRDEWRRPW